MKKIMLIVVALLVILTTGSVFAAETPEMIYETEITVISENQTKTVYEKRSIVEIDGKKYTKIHKIYVYDKFEENFVRYVNEEGVVKKAFHWQVKNNGKVVFPKGKKPVVIVIK